MFEKMGAPVATQKVTAGDVAASLPTNVQECQGVLISVETNAIRYCVGGSTPTTALGHKISAGDMIRLTSNSQISSFKYINAVAESNADLMITGEFL